MESLYVCLFSNAHIKVGRSIDPISRIASHAERVACLGVSLTDRYIVECPDRPSQREARMIAACAEAADRQNLNEWFEGLDFLSACGFTDEACAAEGLSGPRPGAAFGLRLRDRRRARGLSQVQLGDGLAFGGGSLTKATISGWEIGRSLPNIEQLRLICLRLDCSADDLLGLRARA